MREKNDDFEYVSIRFLKPKKGIKSPKPEYDSIPDKKTKDGVEFPPLAMIIIPFEGEMRKITFYPDGTVRGLPGNSSVSVNYTDGPYHITYDNNPIHAVFP
ncbi:MAG: hypothetical protein K0S53_679 [Bacteroidetes bacterium]|jgi:hypothetical protein|nr:hypothetical protein [Bacteroidota bacterium]